MLNQERNARNLASTGDATTCGGRGLSFVSAV
jgi:hypothetical protein